MARESRAKYHGIPGTKKRQCEAARADGSRCENIAMRGSNVCYQSHGGRAPQVKQAARVRLATLVDPAIGKLSTILAAKSNDLHWTPQQQLAAAKDVLDRNGLKAKDEVVITTEFDATRFAHMSTEDIRQLVALARKASKPTDALDGASEDADGDV